jgi:hypothetical protein
MYSRPSPPRVADAAPNPYAPSAPSTQSYGSTVRSPPSPPSEETNKLPSISTLLGIADGDRSGSEAGKYQDIAAHAGRHH